ncbi:MAG TPA: malto-oligosyltrehalose synthase [Thermoanaerobaculia bacterium]|nr:malto-oligosyltrehalose synthase [Thermoanaerobaculia bacterium]
MSVYRVPGSTYRLQMHREFTFAHATEILDYLDALGITDVYTSPLARAREGSAHGYDVTDPKTINPEIGTPDELERFAAGLRERRMGLVLDIVPNHMAASLENRWWFDLLARGPNSAYAPYFDVDWSPSWGKGQFRNTLLFPVLGKPYGAVLEAREIRLTVDEHGFSIRYFDHRFPMSAASLRLLAIWLSEHLGESEPSRRLARLAAEDDPRAVSDAILALTPPRSRPRKRLDELVSRINDGSSTSPPFGELDRLLGLQHYRLAFWRLASEELNYRRFFDISELAGLTIESRETFEAVHQLPLELAGRGVVTGIRIDHIDGLRDPAAYLQRLQNALPGKRFWVVVEKILGPDETIRDDFALSGTTGYEFLNVVNRAFVDAAGIRQIDAWYRRFTERPFSFANVVYRTKRLAIKRLLPGELIRLATRLASLAARDRSGRDIPFSDLRRAIIEISALLPVYRTYIRDTTPDPLDRETIAATAAAAKQANPAVLHPAIDFVARGLALDLSEESEPHKEAWLDLVMRWQQFTGPAMAKGFEDTALYRANRLLSLNEVGSEPDPEPSRLTVDAFHREAVARLARMPHTLNASSTHDTKRSEDVRARINVLSEIPVLWLRAVERWHAMNERLRPRVAGRRVPGPNEEYFVYQTLAGAWPFSDDEIPELRRRLADYAIKAAREAKMHTSWLEPDQAWERAIVRFIRGITDPARAAPFLADFRKLQQDVAFWGAINSLSQLVLKATAPGVPDFYQGTELWDFSLVDPDNRRPVDYDRRRRALGSIASVIERERPLADLSADLMRRWKDGRIKLYTTHRLLALRRDTPRTFRDGTYTPVEVSGWRRHHAIAFTRGGGRNAVLVVVPRLVASLSRPGRFPLGAGAWGNTSFQLGRAPRRWRHLFTGETIEPRQGNVRLADLFEHFPVAVLTAG